LASNSVTIKNSNSCPFGGNAASAAIEDQAFGMVREVSMARHWIELIWFEGQSFSEAIFLLPQILLDGADWHA
jgi:hypothetical protein